MFLDEFESQTSIQGSATTMLIRSVLSSNPKKNSISSIQFCSRNI